MTDTVLALKDITTTVVQNGTNQPILSDLNLTVQAGDFITVLGTNGAGKSTLFNTIAGNLSVASGEIQIGEHDVTRLKEEKRAKYVSRVFQDPKMGTAPRMTVMENLLLAQQRGKSRGLHLRRLQTQRETFRQLCAQTGNGLEAHLDAATGTLSGGQRQALSLLMATILSPDILLLDEHTAALDPKTSQQLMTFTQNHIEQNQLTCLMITHHLEDALKYGNRLIVLDRGQITQDYNAEQKAALDKQQLLDFFATTA